MLKEERNRTMSSFLQNKESLKKLFNGKRVNLYEEPSQLLNEDHIRPDSDLI